MTDWQEATHRRRNNISWQVLRERNDMGPMTGRRKKYDFFFLTEIMNAFEIRNEYSTPSTKAKGARKEEAVFVCIVSKIQEKKKG